MNIFQIEGYIGLFVHFALMAVAIFAFVSALSYRPEAYDAAGKWTKPGWTIVLGIGALINVLGVGLPMLISLAFIIAALVFLADVRPALVGLYRR